MRSEDTRGYGAEPPVDLSRSAGPAAERANDSQGEKPPGAAEQPLEAPSPSATSAPPQWGWRGRLRRFSGGLITPKPGKAEERYRLAEAAARQHLGGSRVLMVASPKGGAGTTTATLLLAHTLAVVRRGSVVAWDNTDARGNLGDRAEVRTPATSVSHLLAAAEHLVTSATTAGDMTYYLRSQPSGAEVLAADTDPTSPHPVGPAECGRIAALLERHVRLTVIDSGNDVHSARWRWAAAAADCLVVPITLDIDVAQAASWMLDTLLASGRSSLVAGAVVLVRPGMTTPPDATRLRILEHFHARCGVVLEVPHDPQLAAGVPLVFTRLGPATRRAWVMVAAAVADQLAAVRRERPDQRGDVTRAHPPARGAPRPASQDSHGLGASVTALPFRRAQA
ncbi:MinD/ParA family protein [Amycolatopsis sp. cmx-4-61]|uniref:MinD/ParA family ATP-binding protein n=1 Tax=Amycolatopsis sp. cmx-4-61 TaxID=2790937 RepID=UPI00397B6E90